MVQRKYCRYCKRRKSIKQFAARKGTTRSNRCRQCQRDYAKQHYRENRQRYAERNLEYKAEIKQLVRQAKAKPCMDCGMQYPYCVMDFDHQPEFEKRSAVSMMENGRYNMQRVVEEIAKCQVVCSNCHRLRTFKNTPCK